MRPTVPFLALVDSYSELKREIDDAMRRVLEHGQYIMGKELSAFESEYAAYTESKFAVGVANGLDALVLALRALDVGENDEVIVPANTYIATWLAVSHVGAKVVPVEPDAHTCNLDPNKIAEKITKSTKAILPVHLFGHPADLDGILEVAKAHKLVVVEDAAQCHGAAYKRRRIGSHSDAVAWSFYPGKNLGAIGDGGAVTTNRADVADRVSVLRNYGSRVKYYNEVIGFNSRLDELQAAILRVKLRVLDGWNERRREIARRYIDALSASKSISLLQTLPGTDHVYHLFVIEHPRREEFQKQLAAAGIATMIHYPVPPHLSGAYQSLGYREGSFPISERGANTHLSLPMGPHLTADDQERVIAACLSDVSARSRDVGLLSTAP